MMHAYKKELSRELISGNINFEIINEMNCFQVREKLDALFDRESLLAETHKAIKRILFNHLENCPECCRSFDVRVRFRSSGRAGIY